MEETWNDSEFADDAADPVAELGTPTAEFRAGGRRLLVQMLLAPLVFLTGAAFLGFPVAILIWGHKGGAVAHLWKLILLGCVMVPGSVMLAVRAFRHRRMRVLVYPEGLVRMDGDRASAFFWEEIDSVLRKTYSANAWERFAHGSLVYTVRLKNGKETSFEDHVAGLQDLGRVIERETLKHLLPRLQAAFDEQRLLDFKKLSVDTAAITVAKATLAWSDVETLHIGASAITIKKKGKWGTWSTVPTAEIPNLHVLAELLRPVLGTRFTCFYDQKG
jgi:hypothetical protein